MIKAPRLYEIQPRLQSMAHTVRLMGIGTHRYLPSASLPVKGQQFPLLLSPEGAGLIGL